MIPTHNEIDVIKAGELDMWGDPQAEEEKTYQGNIRSQMQVVTNSYGEEVVSNYTILFSGLVSLTTNDKIRFVEANGETIETNPISVKYMRDLDGTVGYTKAVL